MTSTADQPISALRTGHTTLTALVQDLPPGGLTGPSGASEWTIAQVLSHLGSGAEIGLAGLQASIAGEPAPGRRLQPRRLGPVERHESRGPGRVAS